MTIFKQKNGTSLVGNIPFNNKKKFFDMTKITSLNPILQRNGVKSSYGLIDSRLQKLG